MDNRQRIFTKNLRTFVNMNQKSHKEICKAIDVLPATFSTWYNGKAMPRMDKCEKIAEYFGCSISDLLEDKNEIYSQSQIVELLSMLYKLKPAEFEAIKNLVNVMIGGV